MSRGASNLLLEKLQSPESSGRLKAVRCIRDQVIGNRSRKLAYLKLGVVERLVELLSDPDGESLIRINCAATVGSLAYGIEDGLRAVLASGGVAQLIQLLSSLEERVVEAASGRLRWWWHTKWVDFTSVSKHCSPAHSVCHVELQQGVSTIRK